MYGTDACENYRESRFKLFVFRTLWVSDRAALCAKTSLQLPRDAFKTTATSGRLASDVANARRDFFGADLTRFSVSQTRDSYKDQAAGKSLHLHFTIRASEWIATTDELAVQVSHALAVIVHD